MADGSGDESSLYYQFCEVKRKFREASGVSLEQALSMMPPVLWPPHILAAIEEAQLQEDGRNLFGNDWMEVLTKMRQTILSEVGVEDGIVTLDDLA